tara:strand:+ start:511 stop:942 length:432 start_codon:yes stop_codon:yes gene_type:complete
MTEFADFLNSDKNYQLILQRHQQVHGEVRQKGYEIMHEARKIKGLLMATDLLIDKLGEHESIAEGDADDLVLRRLTAENSEEWFGLIGQTLDLLREQIVEQCQQVVLAKHSHEKAKEVAGQHCDSLCAAREEARKRFEKATKK